MSSKKHKTPAIRFKGFTDAWEQRKLKDVAPLQRGFDLPKSEISEGPYPVLFSNGIGGWHSEYKAKAPGVITGRSGSIGNVVFIEQNYWPHNTSLWVTNFFDNCPRYVYYLYHHVDLSKFGTGSGVPTLNRNDVHDYSVIIPKPEEQSRIATFFKKLDDTIALHQRQLDNYKELKKAMLQKVFNQKLRFKDDNGNDYPEWESVTLNKICYIKTGNMNVQDSVVEGQYTFFDRSETIKKLDTYSYDEEAIIYPGEGSSFYPKYFKGKYALHQRAYSLSDFKEGCSTKYVYHYLNTKNNHFIRTCVGTTVRSLRMKSFETCEVYLPSYLEQQKIADFLDTMDSQINQISKKVERLREEKKGLLQQMFV